MKSNTTIHFILTISSVAAAVGAPILYVSNIKETVAVHSSQISAIQETLKENSTSIEQIQKDSSAIKAYLEVLLPRQGINPRAVFPEFNVNETLTTK